jgi:ribosomal small subunit protein bTHX
MGRGDIKTAKGKRTKGSFGVSRNKKAIKARLKRVASKKVGAPKTEEAKVAKPRKTARKKSEG